MNSCQVEGMPPYKTSGVCCDAGKALIKLYGGQEISGEYCLHVRGHIKRIYEDNPHFDVRVLRALSDATPPMILKPPMGDELCSCEIMLALENPQLPIFSNLSTLESAGTIKERKNGR